MPCRYDCFGRSIDRRAENAHPDFAAANIGRLAEVFSTIFIESRSDDGAVSVAPRREAAYRRRNALPVCAQDFTDSGNGLST